jgi:hypothetical protein
MVQIWFPWPLASWQRNSVMALAPRRLQRMPDCFLGRAAASLRQVSARSLRFSAAGNVLHFPQTPPPPFTASPVSTAPQAAALASEVP